MKGMRAWVSLTLAFCMLLPLSPVLADEKTDKAVAAAAKDQAKLITQTYKEDPPVFGDELEILGLARSGNSGSKRYFDQYYKSVTNEVADNSGVLSASYDDYSWVILALTAIGRDAATVGGYNLTTFLGDIDAVSRQGVSSLALALLALDSNDYRMPSGKGATREKYVQAILDKQLADGGFSDHGQAAELRATSLVLAALAKYPDTSGVKLATTRGLSALSSLLGQGSALNCADASYAIFALTEQGEKLFETKNMKNGRTLAQHLLLFYTKGKGFDGEDSQTNALAMVALAALQRAGSEKPSLFWMGDVEVKSEAPVVDKGGKGLNRRNQDVQPVKVRSAKINFTDINGHPNQVAIVSLAARGIITGQTSKLFAPDDTMTRAEFAAIITRALGLKAKYVEQFDDVPKKEWYAGFVGTAYTYGIVNGDSPGKFLPDATITREEAGTMVSRAAKLCGLDTEVTTAEIRAYLEQFPDHAQVSYWARRPMTFCYHLGILSQADYYISPQRAITRGEVAEMVFQMLDNAKLL